MTNEPESLTELLEIIDNPPYERLKEWEKEEIVRGWLHRHHGRLFSQEVQVEQDGL